LKIAQWDAGPKAAFSFSQAMYRLDRKPDDWREGLDDLCVLRGAWLASVRHDKSHALSVAVLKDRLDIEVPRTEKSGKYLFVERSRNEKWQPFHEVAVFAADPNKTTLSNCLARLSTLPLCSVAVLSELMLSIPWVLGSILRDHMEGVPLPKLAEEAKAGGFGDYPDWLAAERRFSEQGISGNDFKTWQSGRYITSQIRSVGAPFWTRSVTRQVENGDLRELVEVTKALPLGSKRVRLLCTILFLINPNDALKGGIGKEVLEICINDMESDETVDAVKWRVASALIRAEFDWDGSERLAHLLDLHGREHRNFVPHSSCVRSLINLFNSNSTKRGLLPFITAGLAPYWRPRDEIETNQLVHMLDHSAFQFDHADSAIIKESVALLRLTSGRWSASDVDELSSLLAGLRNGALSGLLFHVFSTDYPSNHPDRMRLIIAVIEKLLRQGASRSVHLVDKLDAFLDQIPSDFTMEEKLRSLSLPVKSKEVMAGD
jgi:hypothetical protein